MKFIYTTPDKGMNGPVTRAELDALVKAGELPEDTNVCAEGTSDWITYAEFKKGHAPSISKGSPTTNPSATPQNHVTKQPRLMKELLQHNEPVIAQLGQGFRKDLVTGGLLDFLRGGEFEKGWVQLTNRTIRGASKTVSLTKRGTKAFTGALTDLSWVSLRYQSDYKLFLLSFILVILGILTATQVHFAFGIIFSILALLTFLRFIFSKQRFILFGFGGEPESISMRGVSNEEIIAFINQTYEQKLGAPSDS